jgi:hypothetical protein
MSPGLIPALAGGRIREDVPGLDAVLGVYPGNAIIGRVKAGALLEV